MKKQKYKIYLDESGQIACQRKRPRSVITTLKRILKGGRWGQWNRWCWKQWTKGIQSFPGNHLEGVQGDAEIVVPFTTSSKVITRMDSQLLNIILLKNVNSAWRGNDADSKRFQADPNQVPGKKEGSCFLALSVFLWNQKNHPAKFSESGFMQIMWMSEKGSNSQKKHWTERVSE